MTKLGDNIYILCGWFEFRQNVLPSIRVYESRHPFNLLWLISIDEMLGSPIDIVSSEKANCLYVSDEAWIYKIDLHICQLVRWKSGANFRDILMSISNEGDLIKLISVNSNFEVGIYRQDALRIKNFQLQPRRLSDIWKAKQAIQTPGGKFVIICEYTQMEYCRRGWSWHDWNIGWQLIIVGGLVLVDSNGVEIKRLAYDVYRKDLPICLTDISYRYRDRLPLPSFDHNSFQRLFINSHRSRLHAFTFHNEDNLVLLDMNSLEWKHVLLTIKTRCHNLLKVWYEDETKLLILGCDNIVRVYTVTEM